MQIGQSYQPDTSKRSMLRTTRGKPLGLNTVTIPISMHMVDLTSCFENREQSQEFGRASGMRAVEFSYARSQIRTTSCDDNMWAAEDQLAKPIGIFG